MIQKKNKRKKYPKKNLYTYKNIKNDTSSAKKKRRYYFNFVFVNFEKILMFFTL